MQKYAVPCIISLLVGALYNIVDQIFIANAAYLGSYGNAANTVVFPLTVVALALVVMIGDGCCAFVSIQLGKSETANAQKIPFYMFGQAMNPIIRADGNPKFAMISTLARAGLNIILDPGWMREAGLKVVTDRIGNVLSGCSDAFAHLVRIKRKSPSYTIL